MSLVFFVARKLSSTAEKVSHSAEKVLNGDREAFVPRKGSLELKRCIDAINSLLNEFNNQENWRKQMMQDLTHELRTPLTSVLSRLEAIIDGVYPLTQQNLNDIYNEIERLSRLVSNVQKLSEAEGARFKLNIKTVDISELVEGTFEGFLFMAKSKNITFRFQPPNRPCYARVDSDRMIQVVTNLISNAIKYTQVGGTVDVGIICDKNKIRLYCSDNGVGLSKEDIGLVFNRFYRTDESRENGKEGSGVGLSISKALIEAHGGTIRLRASVGGVQHFGLSLPKRQNGR